MTGYTADRSRAGAGMTAGQVSSGRGVNATLAMGPMAEENPDTSGFDDSASAPTPTTQPGRNSA